ncbi:MAG: MFS transporter [Chloroflexi bacterium]|nr:MFS transporter [Chloroflexota bacterium]
MLMRMSRPALVLDRRWLFFGLAGLSLLMSSIDGTIVAVALPTLLEDLQASLGWAGWTITAYALTQTVMLPMAGKLAEQFGQMRIFLVSVFLFTLGSLLCGLAPNVYVLVACRVLQAIGGGGFMPSATGIVAQQFPRTRTRMIGLFASIFPIGGIIGPNLGGAIIEQWGWREIFLINVPIGVLVVALLWREARADASAQRAADFASDAPAASASPPTATGGPVRRRPRRSIDVLGTVLFTGMVVSLLTALTLLGEQPSLIRSPFFWLLIVASAALLVGFVWQERRARDPILDFSLVVHHPFGVVNVFGILTGACFMGFFSFIPYYATVQYGMGPLESGAILTPRSLVMIVVSTSISFLLPRLGYRIPMLIGLVSIMATLLLLGQGIGGLAFGPIDVGPIVPLLFMMSLSGFGMGMLIPAANNAGLDLLPQRAAVISGIRGLFNSTGGVIGTAIIVLWLELSPDKAAGMQAVFTALGVVILLTMPLVFLIPDSARERRRGVTRTEPGSAGSVSRPEPADSVSRKVCEPLATEGLDSGI